MVFLIAKQSITSLGNDVIIYFMRFVRLRDLVAFAQTCRFVNGLAKSVLTSLKLDRLFRYLRVNTDQALQILQVFEHTPDATRCVKKLLSGHGSELQITRLTQHMNHNASNSELTDKLYIAMDKAPFQLNFQRREWQEKIRSRDANIVLATLLLLCPNIEYLRSEWSLDELHAYLCPIIVRQASHISTSCYPISNSSLRFSKLTSIVIKGPFHGTQQIHVCKLTQFMLLPALQHIRIFNYCIHENGDHGDKSWCDDGLLASTVLSINLHDCRILPETVAKLVGNTPALESFVCDEVASLMYREARIDRENRDVGNEHVATQTEEVIQGPSYSRQTYQATIAYINELKRHLHLMGKAPSLEFKAYPSGEFCRVVGERTESRDSI